MSDATPAAAVDVLVDAITRAGTSACVGIDPVLDLMPESWRGGPPEAVLEQFCAGVLDAARGRAAAVKFQSACFERFGSAGVGVLERAMLGARARGLFVILDAKRGDIGSTSAHYAEGARAAGAHAVTVNGYLGVSGIEPFLAAGLMVFVLVRTSNPDSDEIQRAALASGGSVAEHMARIVARLGGSHTGRAGLSGVGAVVGATKAADGPALREIMPAQVFLVPGYGAQGGTAEDVRRLRRAGAEAGRGGVLVNASRSVTYPGGAGSWEERVARAIEAFAADVAGLA